MRTATSITLVLMLALIIVISGCQKAPEPKTETPAMEAAPTDTTMQDTTGMVADTTQIAEVCKKCGQSPCVCPKTEEPATGSR